MQETIKSYQDAKEYLEHGRNKSERPYANNTRIRWNTLGHDNIEVTYHGNIVVTFYPNYTSFSSCGWRTMTTKERINWFLPDGFYLYQEAGIWYLRKGHYNNNDGKTFVFADGIVIDSYGNVHNAKSDSTIEEIKALTKQINQYAKGYVKALADGEIEPPSSGDCWYCVMRTDSGESLGDATNDLTHLQSHLDKGYYVPSLFYNAFKWNGGYLSMISQDAIARLWQTGEELSDWQKDILKRDGKSLLTKYLKHKFEIAS